MNPQIKQKWVNALRSGDYQQGQCYLRTNSGFCCLGVLCDLYIKENNLEWNLAINRRNNAYAFQDMVGELPLSVIEWSGIANSNPYFDGEMGTLAALNDDGYTFNEIADVIEKQL
jgi:hypothetical protein